jgi:LacI family transcriptional regulator
VRGARVSALLRRQRWPLSSVRQPRHRLGRTAAQLLLEEASETDTHKRRQVIFEPELEVRRSSAIGSA